MALLYYERDAVHPFYYDKLDLNIYSLPELLYILCRYPAIIPEDFVDRKLTNWLREELGLAGLSDRLEKSAGTEDPDRRLLQIFREGNYLNDRETEAFGRELKRIHELDRAKRSELCGDTYSGIGRYGRALDSYLESVSAEKNPDVEMKLASSYVTVMQFRKASDLYEEIYRETLSFAPLRKLYLLNRLEPSLHTIEKYKNKIGPDRIGDWEAQYLDVLQNADDDERIRDINSLYLDHPKDFHRLAMPYIKKWKQEYRDRN